MVIKESFSLRAKLIAIDLIVVTGAFRSVCVAELLEAQAFRLISVWTSFSSVRQGSWVVKNL